MTTADFDHLFEAASAGETAARAAAADMRRLYASGDFERVSYHLGDSPAGGQVVTVDLSEKAWGPNYLRFGLAMRC